MIKVFIENEAGSNQKNIFNEGTLEYHKTVTVSRVYPFPYGFILNTRSGDGDALDCFVLTRQALKSRSIVECKPVGMFEQVEDGEEDPKVLVVLEGDPVEVTDEIEKKLQDFITHVFDHLPGKEIKIGNFYGQAEAVTLLKRMNL